ncbi:MAG TPA: FGGY-family carbohydrate kinase [Anaerolineaceae bacterium]|nr:FGGY-family carbohydrate kinase [Anaerolineaceae bacterium]HPN51542.1 FGGY-family carbohydrate kinase [Anaerolineaceae bacterium]
MSGENLLAIDNGTQSVRALLFDLHGNLLAKKQVPFEPYYSTAPGLAEQDPEVFWKAVCDACQGLWQQPGVDRSSIAAVSLTTQRNTMLNLDKNGQPLRPAIVWLDQRRAEGVPPVGGLWGAAFRIAGASETVAYLQGEAECNWLRFNQPEIWKQTYRYVCLSGYLTYRLVNRFVDSTGCTVAYLPFDYKTQTWAGKWDWKWEALGVEADKLTELARPTEILGQITPAAAEATGIPVGLPLVAAAADKACEVLGSGCVEPHIASLSYGSAATINTTHQKYIEVIPMIPPYPSAVPGAYSMEIQIYRGYWMVSWFKQEFALREQLLAEQQGVIPEALFDDLVKSVPPGCEGLVLQPYWAPGLRHPGPEARGAIIGFGGMHTRAHIYRAILEGLAYALREGAENTSKRSGVPITALRVAGGGSQSEAAMQLTADIFGLPASRPHVYEASGLGAAMDAAVGMKLQPDFKTAVAEMTRVRDTFEPDPHTHAIYEQLYREVYLHMYQHLKPLYNTLRHIH